MITCRGYDEVIRRVYDHGQEHLFAEWDDLSEDERELFLRELAQIDFDLMNRLYRERDRAAHMDFRPAPYIRIPLTDDERRERRQALERGIEVIRSGRVAAFVVAGGQGSRLGYDGPKGKFPVGPVSGKTLFQIHAEKIVRYGRKYNIAVPFLIMTSDENHSETVAYFREHDNFGIAQGDLFIFRQNMIPSLDRSGNLLLRERHSLFKNPDGHGGSLTALHTSGALEAMRERGIDIISYFQVDNPLVSILDPVFIGFHDLRKADVSSKALKKAYPEEKIGVFVQFSNGRIGVIEYSDLPEEKSRETEASGELAYAAGSIAIHLFNRGFIERITAGTEISLPFHTAEKKLRSYVRGEFREIAGLKFEKFVFDALPLTENNVVFETLREEEFAPVKNPTGIDSVESAQRLMSDLHRSWLAARGIAVSGATTVVEISPLLAVEPGDIDPSLRVPETERVYLE
ncbi:MAG: UTP--glucose-1-phosphate uridylyltransferase [Spirochaetes bacterium]|nr:UTP--glucose-1-phosphate uridylyltransferase [Spirochaetota bacterium]